MDKHFRCTACGKCCFGSLPLTLNDAINNASRFPLALMWTPVPQASSAFKLGTQLGALIKLKQRRQMAIVITPTAYLPPSFPCPELTADNLCGIHASKPSRCRTMPFYPYREEKDQADLLVPRAGWACDTSAAAPVVYHDKKIVVRSDFDQERRELLEQAATMSTYADYMLKYSPWIADSLDSAALGSGVGSGGNVVTSLSSFLAAIKSIDAAALAAQQLPVLRQYAALTATAPDLLDYHRNYAGWAMEMEYLAA